MRILLWVAFVMLGLSQFGRAQSGGDRPQKRSGQRQSTLATEIESGLRRIINEYAGKPNTEATWTAIRGEAADFLYAFYKSRRLVGNKPQEAYWVKIGPETMTATDIAANRKKLMAGFAEYKPAEFATVHVETRPAGKY